jgi:hypothetical protein
MKYSFFSTLIIISTVFIIAGCSKPIKERLAGTWKVEDVQFKTSVPMDPMIQQASEESQKSISYELLESDTAKIHAGKFTTLTGIWVYKEADQSVYMVFTGTFDTILLGKYEDGKLVNRETRPDIEITTIFAKEDR